jgi:hypothetical protein
VSARPTKLEPRSGGIRKRGPENCRRWRARPAGSKLHDTEAQAIRAELRGSTEATALGITAHCNAPVLELSRRLIADGANPSAPLEVWRGDTLALRIRSIGQAAALEINSKGTGFVQSYAVRTGPPVRKTAAAAASGGPSPFGQASGGAA